MIHLRAHIVVIIIASLTLGSCDSLPFQKTDKAEDDTLLASIDNRKMYYSDIAEMMTAKNPQDSIAQLNQHIESWVKRNVVLNEAEISLPENINIDELVEDYKSSLLVYNYRQYRVKNLLDTLITPIEEKEYYDKNKSQYLLEEPLCMAHIAIVSDDAPKLDRFYKNWKKDDREEIEAYLEQNGSFSLLVDDHWYSVSQLMAYLPQDAFSLKNLEKKGERQKHFEDKEYFVKVIDVIDKHEIPPLSYVREKIRKIIIHNRKKELIDNIEQELYNNYMNANKVKVFTKIKE